MKKYFAIAAFAFAALVSCQKEIAKEEVIPAPVPDDYVGYTLYASLGDQTKSTLDGKSVVWAVGDKVAIYADGAGNAIEFTVDAVSAEGVAFSGSAPVTATSFVAVYPFDSAMGISDGIVKVIIPSEQVIPEGGDIDPTAMPSAAVFETVSSKPTFYNLMSLVKFNVGENEYVDEVRIGTDGEICLAGEIDAKVYAAAEPDVFNKCDENIVIKSEVPLLPNKDYYAVVAPAEGVAGFNAGGVSGSRQSLRTAAEAVTFKRNGGLNLGDITKDAAWMYRYISNGDDLKNFLDGAADYPEGWKVEVLEDIFLNNVEISSAANFAGELDGCGYSIKNWDCKGTPLFAVLSGTVKNLTIDSSCCITWAPAGMTGFIASELKGKLENCHNEGDINLDLSVDPVLDNDGNVTDENGGIAGRQIGGLVGRLTARQANLVDCSNSGDIYVKETLLQGMQSTIYVGGLVGIIGYPGDDVVVRLQNCSNSGNIKVDVSSDNTSEQWVKGHYVGGLVAATGVNSGSTGSTKNYGEIRDCVNEGVVFVTWTGGTGGYFKVGGIIGYCEGALFSCVNKGDVNFVNSDTVANAGPSVGGVAGAVAGTAPVSAEGCWNEGRVYFSGMFSNAGDANNGGCAGVAWAAAGGCFGIVADNTTLVQECKNYGEVEIDAKMAATAGSSSSFGGVIGVSFADVVDCDNHASKTTISGMSKNCHMGGVVGYSYKSVKECQMDGQLICTHDVESLTCSNNEYYHNVGGIVGYAKASDGAEIKDCLVNGSASLENLATVSARYGGIVGISYIPVVNCENYAPIKLVKKSVETRKDFRAAYVGGITGLHNANEIISGCSNAGAIDVTMDPNTATSYVAGIVSYTAGSAITDCSNSGDIVLDGGQMVKQMYVAGINGWNNIATNFENLSNSGNITVDNWTNGSYNYIGGITGQYYKSGNGYKNLHNTGNITSTATSKMRLGGIGGAINANKLVMEDCSTTGNIYMTGGKDDSTVGGLTGYWGGGDIKNVSCTGSVTCLESGVSIVGGFIGANNVNSIWENVEVTGPVVAGDDCKAGYILGRFHGNGGQTVTLVSPYSFASTLNGAAPDPVPATSGNAVGNWNSGSFVAQE